MKNKVKRPLNYRFISKALYFPETKTRKSILAIGDLHIGYEAMLIKTGLLTPMTQMKNLINELNSLIRKTNPGKIIFIGDIKHSFGYEAQERFSFKEAYEFLKKHFNEKDIIFIKGNHDTIDYSFENKLRNYYIEKGRDGKDGIAFIHGHKAFPEIYDKNVKTIVLGHIHPSVVFSDKDTSKKEKYKCFLTGKFKKKDVVILPSFFDISIGQPVNEYSEGYGYEDYFSIIPRKTILNFKVHAIGKDKVYDFGKVKKL